MPLADCSAQADHHESAEALRKAAKGSVGTPEHFELEMSQSGVDEDESGADVEAAIVTLWRPACLQQVRRWKRTKPGDAAASMDVADQG